MSLVAQINALKEKRRHLIEVDARGILNTAEAAKRSLGSEEEAQWQRALDDAEKIGQEIAKLERQDTAERSIAAATSEPVSGNKQTRAEKAELNLPEGLRANFAEALRSHYGSDARANLSTPQYGAAFRDFVGGREMRAHQADADISGGFLKAPPAFVAGLIKAVDDELFLRRLATVIPVSGSDSLGAVSLDTDPEDADWTSEIAAASETADLAFGKRELKPDPLSKLAKISRKLLRVAALNPESLLMDRLAYKFAVTQEKAFLTGHGAGRPLGLFTASASGISTARDVSTGNTTTTIEFDGLKEAKYTLKSQYWAKAAWLFHRDAIKQLAKKKDGEGRYLWEAAVRAGEPDRLLQMPFYVSEHAPSTFTTGLYVGMIADFSHYWIADGLNYEVQRLIELYAATNQIGFIGRAEVDGMPVLGEAFVRVKLA